MASKLSQRLLVIWSGLAAAGGCGQILGISDYEVDPTLGAAVGGEGSAGDMGRGGKDGGAGKSSTAGSSHGGQPVNEAGAGGEPDPSLGGGGGAAAGETGAGGAGGAGGSPPEAKFVGCDGTPFVGNEGVLRSCILRVGCLQWLWPTETISRCVSQNSQNVYEGTKCTLDAETCADITACEGKHIESTFCDGAGTPLVGMHCNGNEVVDCDGYVPFAEDCTKFGGTCKDFGADIDGLGTTVACQLPLPANACTATTDAEACSGTDYRYQCYGKVPFGAKCTNFAAGCRSVGGDIGCYYPLNTCSAEGVTCSNQRATWCDGDSKVTFDCGSVGLGCSTSGDYTADGERQCLAPGCATDDVTTCEESCTGGVKLNLCYGGSPVTVDCRDYGFQKCRKYTYDCSKGTGINDCIGDEMLSFAMCE